MEQVNQRIVVGVVTGVEGLYAGGLVPKSCLILLWSHVL